MKHAYLIMAHHRPDILKELINELDYDNNDIYIHIDIKSLNKYNWLMKTRKAGLYYVESINVIWGHYSQIKCEYILLKAAKKKNYDYYHFMTGVTFPIKSHTYIDNFFIKNEGYEFIGFDNNADFSDRIKYRMLLPKYGKRAGLVGKLLNKTEKLYLYIQKSFKMDRTKGINIECKKGLAYFSITDKFAEYVIKKEKFVKHLLINSISGDEIFIQTLAFNSKFRRNIYCLDDEYKGCLRFMPWDNNMPGHIEHTLKLEDFDTLCSSDSIFALKFDGEDGIELINKMKTILRDE